MMTTSYLMCASEDAGSGGVPGSVVVTAGCGHRVWLSPQGLMLTLADSGVRTICEDCTDPDEVVETGELPGIRGDLNRILGPAQAAQVLAIAKADPGRVVRTLQADNKRRRRRR